MRNGNGNAIVEQIRSCLGISVVPPKKRVRAEPSSLCGFNAKRMPEQNSESAER